MAVKRRCAVCPPWTQTVCRHVWNNYWDVKSGNGEGCEHPLDDVAESWRRAGWTPESLAKDPFSAIQLPKRPEPKQGELSRLVETYRKGIGK